MKLPLSWIKEYIKINASSDTIAKRLTMAGLEVDSITESGPTFDGVVIGKVLEAEKHPNADKLQVARVTDGQDTFQVVCGAPNCRAGLTVAFAKIGAVLKDEKGEPFTIKKSKIRGVESHGMLCSADELGLSNDAEGIIELPENFPLGSSLSGHYSDTIFEISLTPNLGHCSSVLGVVRELSASFEVPFDLDSPVVNESKEEIGNKVKVSIQSQEACPRYACRLISGVKVGPSPDWLKSRLEKCGLRSVNNIVDITNYLLMEFGHPLHAFDLDKLEGNQVIVRLAKEGEQILTLDGKERLLKTTDIVISDSKRPVAIAGVMGGQVAEVTSETRNILIESAYFDPVMIRKTSKHLGLQTDASKRFERGTDPNSVLEVLDRAAHWIQKLAGGEIAKGRIDCMHSHFPQKVINCRLSRANQLLGTSLNASEVENIFHRLRFPFSFDGQDLFTINIPTYRVDITAEIDLIEEIARLYGYDNIPRSGKPYHGSSLKHNPVYLFERELQVRLISEGLQQFLTCDLIGPTLLQRISSQLPEHSIQVLNPTSVEQSILRTSLLPGLLQVVKYNVDHQNTDLAGFEIGSIHFKENEQFKETPVFGIILTGKSAPYHWDPQPKPFDFFDLKGIVENVLKGLRINGLSYKNLQLPIFHSGRQASVFLGELEIGSIGEIHPSILRKLDVSQRIYFAEFSITDLMKCAKPVEKIKDLPQFPGSGRDWTLTIKESVDLESLLEAVHSTQSSLLESVALKDIYRSEKLGKEWKNVTLQFFYRDLTKTVEQDRVDAEHQRITQEVNQVLYLKGLIP